jgi:capsular exopolysaccharide synthesis family protein
MRSDTGTGGRSLREYLQVLRRRKLVIIIAVLVAGGVAGLISALQTPLYRATAQVTLERRTVADLVTGATDRTNPNDFNRVAATQARLASSTQLARRILIAQGITNISSLDLTKKAVVEVLPDADVLSFQLVDASPRRARVLANAYASEYVRYRQEIDTRAITQARRAVETQIEELAASGDDSSRLYTNLVNRGQELATLEVLQGANAFVSDRALRAAQVRPRPVRNVIAGILLGLALGIALAFLRQALDVRVRAADDVAEITGLPLLARLGAPPSHLRGRHQLLTIEQPTGAGVEQFRLLKTNVELALPEEGNRSVMVTSALAREGKTTTISNLAVAAAQMGRNVALVDCDLHRPQLSEVFQVDGSPGTSDILRGQASIAECLHTIEVHGAAGSNGTSSGRLDVLPAGNRSDAVSALLASNSLRGLFDQLSLQYDLILVDAPPMLQSGDALGLASRVDALLCVVRANHLSDAALRDFAGVVHKVPAKKLGFVLTSAEADETLGYGYGYGYGGYSGGRELSRSGA